MRNDFIVRKMYLSFVITAILTSLTATVGMMIDNIVVGQSLGSDALGAMGIVGPISLIFSACGNICSSGGGAKAAQALGRGQKERFCQIFTVNVLFVLFFGLLFTILGMIFAPQIAIFLGAKGALLEPATRYLYGYFLGAAPTIAVSAMMSFIRMDGSPRLPLVCIAVMSVANIVLDIMMIYIFRLGMFGMALATTISYCFALATACLHFLKKDTTLRLVRPASLLREFGSTICTGFPSALSRISDTVKVTLLNNMLVAFVSVSAITVLTVRTQAQNFLGSFILGISQAITPTVGMFFGEEDRTAMRDILKITLRFGFSIVAVLAIALLTVPFLFCQLFGVREASILNMSNTALRFFAIALPIYLINTVLMKFYQCTKRVGISSMICILQSLVYTVVFAFILIRPLGATGVWIAFLLGELLTLLTTVLIVSLKNKRLISSLDDIMMLDENFGGADQNRIELSIGNSMDEVMTISNAIYQFGKERNIGGKTLYKLSLCIEEMAGNVVRHAFKEGEKRWLDVTIIDKPETIILRLRDNGAPFDPLAYLNREVADTYGIKMIHSLTEDFEYRRSMGLNNLIIYLNKEIEL